MKKIIYILLFLTTIATFAQEQPNNGFLIPRVSTAERNLFTQPAMGLMIYNTTTDKVQVNVGTATTTPDWQNLNVGSVIGTMQSVFPESPNNGFLPSRLITSEIAAFTSPAKGLMVYNKTTNTLQIYAGASPIWTNFTTNGSSPARVLTPSAESPNNGFLPSRVTDAVRNAFVNPATGLLIFNTTTRTLQFNSGNANSPIWSNVDFESAGAVFTVSACNVASAGTMIIGVAVSSVSQTITVNVTTIGTYSVSAVTSGVTFSATGTFSTLGSQNIVLTAAGTPTAFGNIDFTTSPTCVFTRVVKPSPLPANIVLSTISPYLVASVYDNNYLPYTTPAGLASQTTPSNPDGVNEPTLVNFQGTITTTGAKIKIPYTVTTAPVNLPAYSQTIVVPASYTQDGISRSLTFSYPAQTYAVGSGVINANIKSVGGVLNTKKLDYNTGIGSDSLGWLLSQFIYATNNTTGTANFEVRNIAGIPDRNITNANHRMFYTPIISSTGETWLSNNLGVDYSNMAKADFNPPQQATAALDYKAFGSQFQWGRFSDGHELVNYTSASNGTLVNGTTTTISSTPTPVHSLFIDGSSDPNLDWINPQNNTLWQGKNGINNPCPLGFKLGSIFELLDEDTAYSINDSASAYNSIHKFIYSNNLPTSALSITWTMDDDASSSPPYFGVVYDNFSFEPFTTDARYSSGFCRCIRE